jgi:hypothetical protein
MNKKKNNESKIIDNGKDKKLSSQLTVVSTLGYDVVSTTLPKNFFEGLLIREMELNEEFTMEKLLDLVAQYSLAIEYYLDIEPMKAKAYQNRMEYLLTNKDTLVQLRRQKMNKTEDKDKENIPKINKNSKEFSQTRQYVKFKQEDLKLEDISQQVNTVLNKGILKEDEKKNVKILIDEDIEKQNISWKKKYQSKKKKNSGNDYMKAKGTKKKGMHLSQKISKKVNDDLSINKFQSATINCKLLDKKESKDNIENKIKENINDKKDIIEQKEEQKNEKVKDDDKEENIKEENIKEEKIKEEKIKEENNKEENNKDDNNKDDNNKEEENKEKGENKIIEEGEKAVEEDNKQSEIMAELYNDEENENVINEEKKEEEKKEENKNEIKENPPAMNRKSIVDEDVTRKIDLDEEISKSIDDQIKSLKNIITNLSMRKTIINYANNNDNEEDEDSQNDDNDNSNSNLNKINQNDENNELMDSNVDRIPAKFRSTYYQVESLMIEYMNDFNQCFYTDIFEQFSSGLRELYESKYKKYIEIRNEYHNQIKENEYLLENDENLNEEKKLEIQQTIDSLNEEQQHQIATVEDEFNRKIMDKISEFKLNSFKSNSGIQLLEEQVKLNIYSIINDSFY